MGLIFGVWMFIIRKGIDGFIILLMVEGVKFKGG